MKIVNVKTEMLTRGYISQRGARVLIALWFRIPILIRFVGMDHILAVTFSPAKI